MRVWVSACPWEFTYFDFGLCDWVSFGGLFRVRQMLHWDGHRAEWSSTVTLVSEYVLFHVVLVTRVLNVPCTVTNVRELRLLEVEFFKVNLSNLFQPKFAWASLRTKEVEGLFVLLDLWLIFVWIQFDHFLNLDQIDLCLSLERNRWKLEVVRLNFLLVFRCRLSFFDFDWAFSLFLDCPGHIVRGLELSSWTRRPLWLLDDFLYIVIIDPHLHVTLCLLAKFSDLGTTRNVV